MLFYRIILLSEKIHWIKRSKLKKRLKHGFLRDMKHMISPLGKRFFVGYFFIQVG
jgi:hypothetical protein